MKKFKETWRTLDTLDDRIYFLTTAVSSVVCWIAIITGILQKLPWQAEAAVFVIFLFMVAMLYAGIRFPEKRDRLRVILIIGIDFIFFPAAFITSGGIYSGMILFYLVGLFLVAVMLRGNIGGLLFVLAQIWMILTVEFSQHFPELVAPMTPEQHFQDVKVTLLLSGIGLYFFSMLIKMAYSQEKEKNRELMETLQNLSVKDALSGLYNRRELFRRLEVMYEGEAGTQRKDTLVRQDHYIAMFDIDNFKALNDNYGHSFGDEVLRQVSDVLLQMVRSQDGEIASRYGGEEFVCILAAADLDEAYRRCDAAREAVSSLKWEDVPGLGVTISGGVVACDTEADLKETLKKVDDLLYAAKHGGKNSICL